MTPATTYISPPVCCEPLASVAARAGGLVSQLGMVGERSVSGGEVIEYPLPAQADADLREYFRASARLECPPLIVARLSGGRVFGPGHVLSPDGTAIARDVSLDFGKAPDDHWLLTYSKIRPPDRRIGSAVVIATSLGVGYCHWLLEELPRWLAAGSQVPEDADVILHARATFAREALALLGETRPMTEPGRLGHLQYDELIVPSLLGPEGRPTPAVLSVLAEVEDRVLGAKPKEEARGGERLYISRDRARRRRVANEAELWSALEARGFRRLYLEDMPWRDQLAAFRSAKIVVASHGAGLANLVWCQPGTRVVELFRRDYVNGLFWQLAAMKGLDYRPLVRAGEGPLSQTLSANKEDMVVDVERVIGELAAL